MRRVLPAKRGGQGLDHQRLGQPRHAHQQGVRAGQAHRSATGRSRRPGRRRLRARPRGSSAPARRTNRRAAGPTPTPSRAVAIGCSPLRVRQETAPNWGIELRVPPAFPVFRWVNLSHPTALPAAASPRPAKAGTTNCGESRTGNLPPMIRAGSASCQVAHGLTCPQIPPNAHFDLDLAGRGRRSSACHKRRRNLQPQHTGA